MALVTLLIGSAFALVHLGRPERAWQFLTNPQIASPLVWDFVAIMTYMLATVVFLYLPMIPDLAIGADYLGENGGWRVRLYRFLSRGWQGLHAQHRLLNTAMTAIAILIIPVAITVHSVLSWAFAVHHREGWHSSIFGPYFVMAALYSGVAMVILVVSAFRKAYGLERFVGVKQFRYLGFLLLVLGPLYLYFTFSDLLTESYVMSEGGQHFIEMLLLTNYAPMFWTFVALGIVLPTLLVAWPRTQTVAGITLASALIVATLWLKRFLIVVPTLIIDDPVLGSKNLKDEEKPMYACVRSSRFQRNEQVVWRTKVYDPQTGDLLGDKDISISVKLADGQVFEMKYGPHPKDPPGDYFWTAPFNIPMDYPAGVLNYEYVVKTKDGRKANLVGFDIASSNLQILDSVRPTLEKKE